MNEIVTSCLKIQNTRFPCQINDVNYNSLTDFVHQITRNAHLPFSAYRTENYKRTFVYACTFAQYGCSSKLVFTQFTDYFENHYFTFELQFCCLQHNNHPLNTHFVEAHRNCLPQTTIDQIRFQTQLGVLPGRIRSNLDVEIGSTLFYDIRRSVIHEEKTEDLVQLIQFLREGNQKHIIVHDPNDTLESITIIDKDILNSNYASDIAIMDDTAMTNMYGLAIEEVIVVDQEDHSQLLGYSVLSNKSEDGFSSFFKDYSTLNVSQFRIIVVDRLEAQYNALEEHFPDTYIVFCLVHIKRDLLTYFNSNDGIIIGFEALRKNPLYSFEYLNYLMRRKDELKGHKGYRCIEILINRYEHWLPLLVIQHGFYFNIDTSRIEGFFGLLKGNYGHDRGTLTSVIKNLNNLCGLLKTQSYRRYSYTFNNFSNFNLIKQDELKLYGGMVLNFLQIEYDAFNLGNTNIPCVWCELRRRNDPHAIPCRHTITNDTIINVNQIHPRFLRYDDFGSAFPNTVLINNENTQITKNRSCIY